MTDNRDIFNSKEMSGFQVENEISIELEVQDKDENEDKKLKLQFDPNTIEHLGISLYSKLPSVLSELISNSWDADADIVSIDFISHEDNKEIIYSDDGNGMSFEELEKKYLVIGRNRRKKEDIQFSEVKQRPVIGKKGLGKLSVFGICNVVEVCSIRDGLKNEFHMNLDHIKKCISGAYEPQIILQDVETDEESGTTITLKDIRRKSEFDLNDIALSLSKKFQIFDRMKVNLNENSSEDSLVEVNNELKFENFIKEFTWNFPDESYDPSYEFWNKLSGNIFTFETPVKDPEMKGIYLTSRGKIVNSAEFYGARDNDLFHGYVSGYLDVSFIDDFDEDVISTDRLSLNWENEKTKELQLYLHEIIKKIGSDWRKKRAEKKKSNLKITKNVDIDEWQNKLPTYEKELSNKIINPILENSDISTDESEEIITGVMGQFENQTFKEYASHIADISQPQDMHKFLKLMDEWKSIEAKEIQGLAYARVEVIKQFEAYLNTDTKEVPTLHTFLKKFSWLLDPRILEFRDEVRYSQLLKEQFEEEKLEENDRRIDFLCSSALGEILYVIEIKRSQYTVNYEAIEQAYDYGSFLREHYATQTGFSKVVCFVIGGKKSSHRKFKDKEQTYMQTGEVFVKTYSELLEQSKEYHKEFLEAYDKHKS